MKSTRIILDAEQSEILAELGECFLVACRGSYPDAAKRMVLHCLPVSRERIKKAVAVARGELDTKKPAKAHKRSSTQDGAPPACPESLEPIKTPPSGL